MSRNGERIGRRLAKRHGFKFLYDPCNFRIACDRQSVMRNVIGGNGCMQWDLRCNWGGELPRIGFRDQLKEAEIGSDYGASTVLKWKHWHVYLNEELTGPGNFILSIWINNGHGEDKTEL